MSDDSHVTYSVKELLSQLREDTMDGFRRLENRFDALAKSVSEKADAAHVQVIDERLKLVEEKIGSALAVDKYKKWLIGVTVGVIGLILTVAGIILT